MRPSRSFRLRLFLVSLPLLCAVAALPLASGRPGGGQSYHAPTRVSPSRPSTPSYHPPAYHPTPTYIPPVVPSSPGYNNNNLSDTSTPSRSGGGGFVTFLFILLILGLIVWWFVRKGRSQRATINVNQGAQDRGIAALKARDPAFDPAAFVERTRATVAKVNEAWLSGAMGPARRLISDGVYVRFQTQLGLQKADGVRNVMADWKVVSADILAAEGDDLWDTVHVKIVGEARDTDVPVGLSKEDADKKARGAALSQYQEVWSFIRRRGKHSKAGVPALSGQCPSCGADLPLSDAVQCEFCKAIVNSGEHDWVLAEITQPEEWSVRGQEAEVPGLAELRQRDPSVSRQELEDRASVIFWKWVEARHTGKVEKLARFLMKGPQNLMTPDADPGAPPVLDAETIAAVDLKPAKLTQVVVGSSDVLTVRPGAPGVAGAQNMDQVLVEIRWSAAVNNAAPVGMVQNLLLGRAAGVVSKRGLSSLDCPVCKGNLGNSDDVKCPYCGEYLPGGKHEWALVRVQVGEQPMAETPDDGDDS